MAHRSVKLLLNSALASTILVAGCLLLTSTDAHGQYMYLDANGDGLATLSDRVKCGSTNIVDVWLVTNANADGSKAKTADSDLERMTINSYEFILRAVGGRVEFGEYTNRQKTMHLPLDSARNDTEMYIGFAGSTILPPGRYRLGTLSFRVVDGNPRLVFAASSSLGGTFQTSFGSGDLGFDGDNTLKLSTSVEPGSARPKLGPRLGDWGSVAALEAEGSGAKAAAIGSKTSSGQIKFGATVRNAIVGEGGAAGLSLQVTTTRLGPLHIALFDVRGRQIRILERSQSATPGVRQFRLDPRPGSKDILAAGVYFYRVTGLEGQLSGRFVLLK